MTQAEKLQKLVDQVDGLTGLDHHVVERRGRSYYARNVDDPQRVYFFETFAKGESWLKRWIADGRRPSMADLRIGVRA